MQARCAAAHRFVVSLYHHSETRAKLRPIRLQLVQLSPQRLAVAHALPKEECIHNRTKAKVSSTTTTSRTGTTGWGTRVSSLTQSTTNDEIKRPVPGGTNPRPHFGESDKNTQKNATFGQGRNKWTDFARPRQHQAQVTKPLAKRINKAKDRLMGRQEQTQQESHADPNAGRTDFAGRSERPTL